MTLAEKQAEAIRALAADIASVNRSTQTVIDLGLKVELTVLQPALYPLVKADIRKS